MYKRITSNMKSNVKKINDIYFCFQVFVLLITFMLVLFKFAMVLAYAGQRDNVVTTVYNATTVSMFDWCHVYQMTVYNLYRWYIFWWKLTISVPVHHASDTSMCDWCDGPLVQTLGWCLSMHNPRRVWSILHCINNVWWPDHSDSCCYKAPQPYPSPM